MKLILRFLKYLILTALIVFVTAFYFLPLPGTIPVLMYHYIGTEAEAKKEKSFVTAETFRAQLEFLKRFGYHPVSIDDYYAIRSGQKKGRGKEILITFDDAHYSFKDAFEILKHYEFPVTVFVISEAAKGNLKNGSLDAQTLKEMSAQKWLKIESHTKTHPALSQLTPEQIKDELAGSKKDLEELFGIPINFLAYSSGDFDSRVIDIAKESGYLMAFTTSHKRLKNQPRGPYSITRNKVSEQNAFIFWFSVSGIYEKFKAWRHQMKQKPSPNLS